MDKKTYENIIDKEAKSFSKILFEDRLINSLTNLKDRLNTKLYDFQIDSYKIRFLNKLKDYISVALAEHNCKKEQCSFEEEHKLGLFLVDQELKTIYSYFEPELNYEDKFNKDEILLINTKLDQLLIEIEKLGIGQEVIFNEVDEIRDYLHLGKKTTRQLVYGKLKDIVVTKGVEMAVAEPIFESLIRSFKEVGSNIIENI